MKVFSQGGPAWRLQLTCPHRVDFYIILYITEGVGKHYIDFQTFKYKKGSILFISRGQVHAFDVCSGSEGFLIVFTDEFLSKNLIHSDILSFYRLYNYHLHKPLYMAFACQEKNYSYRSEK